MSLDATILRDLAEAETLPPPPPTKIDDLNAILNTTARLTGDAKLALEQMRIAADNVGETLGLSGELVRAFVIDQAWNLQNDGRFAA